MSDDVIWIVTDEPPQVVVPDGSRDGGRPNHPLEQLPEPSRTNQLGNYHRTAIPVAKLEQSMAEFLQAMGHVVRRAKQSAEELGGMSLDEIELAVEVNSEGQLSLLGSGAKVGGKGSMVLKFKAGKLENNSPR